MNRYLWFLEHKQANEMAPMSTFEEPTSDIQRTPALPPPGEAPPQDPIEEEARRLKLEMAQMALQQKQEMHQQRMQHTQELHDVKLQEKMPPQPAPPTPEQSHHQILSNYLQAKMGSAPLRKVAREIVRGSGLAG